MDVFLFFVFVFSRLSYRLRRKKATFQRRKLLCGVPIPGLVSIVPANDEIETFSFNCPTVPRTAASTGLRLKLWANLPQIVVEKRQVALSAVDKFLHNYLILVHHYAECANLTGTRSHGVLDISLGRRPRHITPRNNAKTENTKLCEVNPSLKPIKITKKIKLSKRPLSLLVNS